MHQEGQLARMAAAVLRLVVLTAFAVFFIAPIIWLILAPTKSDGAIVTSGPFAFGSFHQIALAWKHLTAFSGDIFGTWMKNSLLYAFGATAIVLVTAIPAGYGLALGRFPGRKLTLTLTLVVMIMPAAALVLPIFLEINSLHLIGSVFSVILPFSFFPFGVYLAYIYYATAIPRDLLDAARADGCGEWQTFRRIALPLAKPVVALVFFFSFVADWNNFFLPYAVLANSSQYPIPVGLSDLLASTPSFNPASGGGGQQVNIFRPELALATLLAVIPVAVVFLLSQRALVRGMLGGAVKE
ncbi:MAG TPA: carbohydrate ABC transporter permease [Streptosporangiaceae bacterium]|nr:carbohydrate ABC transporter permease [Streptosporangiaceae bacterium]